MQTYAVVFVALLLAVPQQAPAKRPTTEFLTEQREALRGIKSFVVGASVEGALRDLLNEDAIKTNGELRLRQAGCVVTDRLAAATVDIGVSGFHVKGIDGTDLGLVAYSVSVTVAESLPLPSDGSTERFWEATIWHKTVYGAIGAALVGNIRQSADDAVAALVNDWLAVNPKKNGPRRSQPTLDPFGFTES
jgi:hypothetical protein